VSRNYVEALSRCGVPIVIVNAGPDERSQLSRREVELFERNSDLSRLAGEEVQLIINHVPLVAERLLDELVSASARLGFRVVSNAVVTIFETESIPREWLPWLMRFDRVVVPTEFNRITFSNAGVPMSKLKVVPYCIDTEFFHPVERIPRDVINLLYVFDFTYRKGVDLLLEAYGLLRDVNDVTVLTLKVPGFLGSSGSRLLGFIEDEVLKRFGRVGLTGFPRIQVDIGSIHVDRLRDLYWNTDIYVSTDRANGWGMPALEAMACGVPVSAIEYSGGAQFVSDKNGYPIETTGRLVPVDGRLADEVAYYEGESWGEVAASAVAEALNVAIHDPLRFQRGIRARDSAVKYGFDAVGELFVSCVLEG
jgi:glycosyltransferase involved in cell wall biosynthesis